MEAKGNRKIKVTEGRKSLLKENGYAVEQRGITERPE